MIGIEPGFGDSAYGFTWIHVFFLMIAANWDHMVLFCLDTFILFGVNLLGHARDKGCEPNNLYEPEPFGGDGLFGGGAA